MPLSTLHRAAVEGDAEAVARLLDDSADAAALAAAATDDDLGMTALDFAAFKGHPEILATAADDAGCLPLHWAARYCQAEAAGLLLEAAPRSLALAKGSSLARRLYAEVVASHACNLGDWHLVPLACPGLAAALPAVLQRSEWEAAQLARRLPAEDTQRLQLAALALNRAQARAGLPLPQPLVWRILTLSCAGEGGC
ncbi:hypothetical protein COHA_006585 [Chlorella ohadii]|uniref:Uncharacterized protein n=1 Tax=Chlorella ohadii TaxID=2649997 RepID=A0AAD5DKU0_9CHLO|nr:hypothetical protein COHA_006585 [Chlorella ohadii]